MTQGVNNLPSETCWPTAISLIVDKYCIVFCSLTVTVDISNYLSIYHTDWEINSEKPDPPSTGLVLERNQSHVDPSSQETRTLVRILFAYTSRSYWSHTHTHTHTHTVEKNISLFISLCHWWVETFLLFFVSTVIRVKTWRFLREKVVGHMCQTLPSCYKLKHT